MIIHWFRHDLRLSDNPALSAAVQAGEVLPVYIWDTVRCDPPLGEASRWWLHHSLQQLDKHLGGQLNLYAGDPLEILKTIIQRHQVTAVYWNRCYEPWQIQRDTEIKKCLTDQGIKVITQQASLLWEPWQISKEDGTAYKVFTPYHLRGCLRAPPPRQPLPVVAGQWFRDPQAISLESLSLITQADWEKSLSQYWQIGESAAQQRLTDFINSQLDDYKVGRDFPARNCTSRLSPYLHFGELSPHQVWHAVAESGDDVNRQCFLRELVWREFSYYLLYHFPQLPTVNWNRKFDQFAWVNKSTLLKAWHRGSTGFPIIDAGMRELWQTGTMHNRVRMLVASFLTKNGLVDWRKGADWFWDCLVDADLANNSASWQWVAGCGADAAPYFRIFNPVLQSQKFDPQGAYIRRFVPEIKALPDQYIHMPATAPDRVLAKAGIILGQDYPQPILNLSATRAQALGLYQMIRHAS